MSQTLKIKISGRVQGVMFRDFTRRNANNLGFKGFVQNKDDGSVQVVVTGEEDKLEIFLELLKKGSVFSKVTNVEFEPFISSEVFEDFKIRYSGFWDRF